MKIVLFCKPGSPQAWGVSQEVVARAARRGIAVIQSAENWSGRVTSEVDVAPIPWEAEFLEQARAADVAIAIGGDGTLLGMARALHGTNIPLTGIYVGTLGFLIEAAPQSIERLLNDIEAKDYSIEPRAFLRACQGNSAARMAFNDVTISSQGRLAEYSVKVDGDPAFSFRADGLIITTPSGSTAYSLAAGGALLHPKLQGIGIVPLNPQSMAARPIILASSSTITVQVRSRYAIRLDCDGQEDESLLSEEAEVTVQQDPYAVPLLHLRGYNYFEVLREKLGWAKPF